MSYPSFNESSIQSRCYQDLDNFFRLNHLKSSNQFELELIIDEMDYKIIKRIIKSYIKIYQLITMKSKDFSLNYSKDIHLYSQEFQQKLWIWRTFLFYQMLIFSVKIMKNESLFNQLYKNSIYKNVFNRSYISELDNFRICIFGSISPGSDIDVSIHYTGDKLVYRSYIIKLIEDMFSILLINCQYFDIEFYADLITVKGNDYHIFYLDTLHFPMEYLIRMMPYIGVSILRNYIFACKSISSFRTNLNREIMNFDFNLMFKYLPKEILNAELLSILRDSSIKVNPENEWQVISKKLTLDYFTQSYDQLREIHYKLLKIAEDAVFQIQQKIKIGNEITHDEILSTMEKISYADIYRSENYICSPTVMHVVKILQEGKDKPGWDKYSAKECALKSKPICGIGKIGYIISILEQIGYIIRYELCYSITNDMLYKHKIEKYQHRILHATDLYMNLKSSLIEDLEDFIETH